VPLSPEREGALKPKGTFKECVRCPEMIVVPAGSFTMGSPESEPERLSDESPQLKVTIDLPFAVGKFAVTRGEFETFVKATGHQFGTPCITWSGSESERVQSKSFREPGFSQDDNHPVVCVNWHDAKAYVSWLSKSTGKVYWLLSEAQREYVTRAGTTTPFWWGSSVTPVQANYNGNYVYRGGGAQGEYRERTVPVDSFAPNPWGLYNVHGNISEWTEDRWYDSNSGNPGNGDARTRTGDSSNRVVRGGAWGNDPRNLRAPPASGMLPTSATTTLASVSGGRLPLEFLSLYLLGSIF
jgi:formylglycine-generating enzyme required for sulfatase activity